MAVNEFSLEELFIHRQALQAEIDKDIEHLKQMGHQLLILTAEMNEINKSLSEKIQIKDQCDQALCEYKIHLYMFSLKLYLLSP